MALQEAVQREDWDTVMKLCDEGEFDPTVAPEYVLQFVVYLLLDKLPEARFLWKRIPQDMRNDELRVCHQLFCCLWHREYKTAPIHLSYWHAQFFIEINRNGEVWSAFVRPVVNIMVIRVRERVFELVSRCFETIPTTEFANMVGLETPIAEQAARERNWFVGTDGYIQPGVIEVSADAKLQISDAKLENLTQYMSFLEQHPWGSKLSESCTTKN